MNALLDKLDELIEAEHNKALATYAGALGENAEKLKAADLRNALKILALTRDDYALALKVLAKIESLESQMVSEKRLADLLIASEAAATEIRTARGAGDLTPNRERQLNASVGEYQRAFQGNDFSIRAVATLRIEHHRILEPGAKTATVESKPKLSFHFNAPGPGDKYRHMLEKLAGGEQWHEQNIESVCQNAGVDRQTFKNDLTRLHKAEEPALEATAAE